MVNPFKELTLKEIQYSVLKKKAKEPNMIHIIEVLPPTRIVRLTLDLQDEEE